METLAQQPQSLPDDLQRSLHEIGPAV